MILELSILGASLLALQKFQFSTPDDGESQAWNYVPPIDTNSDNTINEVPTNVANYSDADYDYGDAWNVAQDPVFSENIPMNTSSPINVNHPLAQLIRAHESGGAYNIVYGGRRFSDYSQHPYENGGEFKRLGIKPATITTGVNKGQVSTAAGRYQILGWVWRPIQQRLNLPDFSPTSQDQAMIELVPKAAWQKYANGDVAGSILLLGPIWTSLPGSPTGESRLTLSQAVREVQSYV
jgi:muramidase (phage lysozyme)